MRQLECIGTDSWERPVYKDEAGILWKDVNLGSGEPYLHSASNNEFDGEPDMPITGEFKIIKEFKESDKRFQYMMLDRLRIDCDYYLGYGNRNPNRLHGDNVAEHIEHMKELWNSFEDMEKPEWLTWEQILKYEKEMTKT